MSKAKSSSNPSPSSNKRDTGNKTIALKPEQLEEFKKAFQMFDLNGDGKISTAELAKTVRVLGKQMTQAEIKQMIKDGDKDGDGALEFNEFCEVMQKQMENSNTKDDLKKAFKVFDMDGDGLISSEELKHVMMNFGEKLTKSEADLMIKEADTNGDGFVDYNEFIVMMTEK